MMNTAEVEILYLKYKNLLLHIANCILGDKNDSEDIVHDTYIKIIEKKEILPILDHQKAINLMITITRNKSIDLYRRRKRLCDRMISYADLKKEVQEEIIITNHDLTKAMDFLPADYKEILLMYYEYGYSIKEITQLTTKTSENIKKIIQRSRKKIRDYLEYS